MHIPIIKHLIMDVKLYAYLPLESQSTQYLLSSSFNIWFNNVKHLSCICFCLSFSDLEDIFTLRDFTKQFLIRKIYQFKINRYNCVVIIW